MYVNIHQDKRCGNCKSLNQHEFVTRGNQQIIRCTVCGHEKVESVMTSSSTSGKQVIYEAKDIPTQYIY